jgi:ferredoxin--NADP+ reductase
MKLVHNELYATEAGTLRPRAIEKYETIPVGLVFRSIGYRGVPLPDVPFNDSWGVILNEGGRVLDPETKEPRVGEYTSGWIKRGPTGVIGTNKPDSVETVEHMLADLAEGRILQPARPTAGAIEQLIAERQPCCVTYADWQRLDELETKHGEEQGRPRVKYTSIKDMLAALGK